MIGFIPALIKPLQASNPNLLTTFGSLEKALLPIISLVFLINKSKTGAQL